MREKDLHKDRHNGGARSPINAEWARSQIEAFEDGSLSGEQRVRMRDVLAGDSRLAAEVERARSVRGALRALGGQRLPRGLRGRLLKTRSRREFSWRAVMVPALGFAAAVLVTVIAFRGPQPMPGPEPQLAAQPDVEQAIEEFVIAMRYLRVGAERSREQLGEAVGLSVRLALATSHDSLRERQSERSERNEG